MIILGTSTVLGGLIGWITNKIAIKMLFKPVKPTKILFFTIQGVFPKRQEAIAKSLGKIVQKELVGIDDFKSALLTDENIEKIKEKLKEKLKKIIADNIPPMFLAMAGEQINNIIENFANSNDDFIKELLDELIGSNDNIDIEKIVEDKVNNMDFRHFESVLLELISNELKHVEYLGAVLGVFIGITQGILIDLLT